MRARSALTCPLRPRYSTRTRSSAAPSVAAPMASNAAVRIFSTASLAIETDCCRGLCSAGFDPFGSAAQGGSRLVRQGGKRGRIGVGDVRKRLAVETDLGQFQPVHEAAVGQPLRACGSVDALHPQGTDFALFDSA